MDYPREEIRDNVSRMGNTIDIAKKMWGKNKRNSEKNKEIMDIHIYLDNEKFQKSKKITGDKR